MVRKLEEQSRIGETDDMALAGILSTQLVHHRFVTSFEKCPPVSDAENVKVCHGPPHLGSAGGRLPVRPELGRWSAS